MKQKPLVCTQERFLGSNKVISKMIKRDIDSDNQWEQFLQEFSSVEEGFLTRLSVKFGTFAKSEICLIATW